ncbi:MAG TPA: dienelactone hydrolase family protein [Myxococcota bacterium]|jgi:carboxymethylenebutenolidase
MIEQEIDVRTRDGAMNTFVVHPDEGGPFPPVFFYMDAPGKREELHDMARRIAAVGYWVALPNLYYRRVREFAMERSEPGMQRMFEMMSHLSNTLVVHDTEALLAFADAQPAVRPGAIGCVGYCMSGPFVIAAAAAFPERVAAAASIYGARLVTDAPDSAHLAAPRIQGELYLACAEIDRWASKEQIDALAGVLHGAGVNHRIEWYPGAEHGFAFPQREGIYHKPSAERHWERLFALFARNLKR